MQRNRDSRLDLVGRSLLASRQNVAYVPSMPETEELRQLLHYRTKVPGWLGRLLAAWTPNSTQSRGQVARTPCLEKTDFSHSFSPYYIYTLIPTILRELPERILREKPVRDRSPGPFYMMLGQTHVNGWSRVIASQNGGLTSYISPLRLGVLQWSRHLFNYWKNKKTIIERFFILLIWIWIYIDHRKITWLWS